MKYYLAKVLLQDNSTMEYIFTIHKLKNAWYGTTHKWKELYSRSNTTEWTKIDRNKLLNRLTKRTDTQDLKNKLARDLYYDHYDSGHKKEIKEVMAKELTKEEFNIIAFSAKEPQCTS